MLHGHDFITIGLVPAPCRDEQIRWQGLPLDDERVIPHRREGRRDALEQLIVLVDDRARLAVHQPVRLHDLPPERLADCLVAEADAEHRHLARERAHQRDGDPSLSGGARAGRDHGDARLEREHARDRDRVVAVHGGRFAQRPEVLDEVVGEGIVVVEDEQHEGNLAGGGRGGQADASP